MLNETEIGRAQLPDFLTVAPSEAADLLPAVTKSSARGNRAFEQAMQSGDSAPMRQLSSENRETSNGGGAVAQDACS